MSEIIDEGPLLSDDRQHIETLEHLQRIADDKGSIVANLKAARQKLESALNPMWEAVDMTTGKKVLVPWTEVDSVISEKRQKDLDQITALDMKIATADAEWQAALENLNQAGG